MVLPTEGKSASTKQVRNPGKEGYLQSRVKVVKENSRCSTDFVNREDRAINLYRQTFLKRN